MKRIGIILAGLLAMPWISLANRYEQSFSKQMVVDDVTLERQGVSTLVVGYIFNVYVAALYQPVRISSSNLTWEHPRHLEIEYLRNISKVDFIKAADDMLLKQHTASDIDAIRAQIEQINQLYQDVKKGDRYALTYRPGIGTELSFNGNPVGVIHGEDFARIYWTIWLGEQHPYQDFRDRLVGLKK